MIAKDLTVPQLYNVFLAYSNKINPFGATVQCIHESTSGASPFGSGLAVQANNLAGIKATGAWKGKTITKKTWEQTKEGTPYQIEAKFKAWDTVEDFAKSYSDMVESSYPMCSANNFLGYFSGFYKGKYGAWATDINYFKKLLSIAWNHSPIFFENRNDKWVSALVYASDNNLFVSQDHEKIAIDFVKAKNAM